MRIVSWKGLLLLGLVLAALGVYAWVTRPQPPPEAPPLFPCDVTNALDVLVTGRGGAMDRITG